MPSYLFDTPEEESRIFGEIEARRRSARSYDPVVARRAGANFRQYPWLLPGANLALSQAGHGPDSPVTQRAAQASANRKVNKSGGWFGLGDVVTSVGRAVGGAIEEIGDLVDEPIKGAARGIFSVLEYPYQLGQAQFRSNLRDFQEKGFLGGGDITAPSMLQGTEKEFRQTHLGLMAEDVAAGRDLDTGSGFFVGGNVAKRQAANARRAYSIDGHAATPGRWAASAVTEPGTGAYNLVSGLLDAGVAIADPSAMILGKVSTAAKARHLFTPEAAGLVGAARKTVLPEVVDEWLSGDGRKVTEWIAGEGDFNTLWRRLGKKVDPEVVLRLQRASTPDQVDDVLRPLLGTQIREKLTVRRNPSNVRLAQAMPGRWLTFEDSTEAVEQLDRFQRNAKLSEDVISANNQRLAEAFQNTDPQAKFDIVTDVMRQTGGVLANAGVTDPGMRRKLTELVADHHLAGSKYFVDEIGLEQSVRPVNLNGTLVDSPTPHLFVEAIQRGINLPDPRAIRRVTSTFGRLLANDKGNLKLPFAATDFLMQEMWKPFTLIRGAWTVRVVGEEQVRMAASGLTSAFSHPLSFLSWLAGDETKLAAALKKAGVKERGGYTLLDENPRAAEAAKREAGEFLSAMNRRNRDWRVTRTKIHTKHWTTYAKTDDEYVRAWGDELAQLNSDPLAQRVAGGWTPGDRVPGGLSGNHADDAKRWFGQGPGKKFREQMGIDAADSDAYVESVFRRIQVKTQNDPELMDAVASGRLSGSSMYRGDDLDAEFLSGLGGKIDIGPEAVKGDVVAHMRNKGGDILDSYDRAVDAAFAAFMGIPSDVLSRSVSWRQFYWQRTRELLPYMDEAAQRQALDVARKANLPKKDLRALEDTLRRGAGDLSVDEADLLAKGFAMDETKGLLYDLSNRSQFFDATRLLFPFGEAWKEILQSWAKIGVQNPQVLRRGQQVVQGARGAGFFQTDPQTGQEVFVYPGSEFVTGKLLGVPVPLTGSVEGLSIATSVIPGVGPAVQWPAAAFLPEKPEFDAIRQLILPFGSPAGIDSPGDLLDPSNIVDVAMPAWSRKFAQAMGSPDDERMWNSTVGETMRYLASTGDYDLSNPDDMLRLADDAADKAKGVYMIRGFAQSFAPSAPTPRFQVVDKSGNLAVTARLVQEWYEIQQTVGYEQAPQEFLRRHGPLNLLVMQAKSSNQGAAPPTDEGSTFEREHAGLFRKHEGVAGLFAPQQGEFDITAYQRQFESGGRESLTPEQMLRLANSRVGSNVYAQARKAVGDNNSREAQAALRALRLALVAKYPGYGEEIVLRQKPETMIRRLTAAIKEPELARTDTGQAVSTYLEARDIALKAAEGRGLATLTGAGAADLADALRAVASALIARHPDFSAAWDFVLSRELPEEPQQEVA